MEFKWRVDCKTRFKYRMLTWSLKFQKSFCSPAVPLLMIMTMNLLELYEKLTTTDNHSLAIDCFKKTVIFRFLFATCCGNAACLFLNNKLFYSFSLSFNILLFKR